MQPETTAASEWPSVLRTVPRALFLFFRAAPGLSLTQLVITAIRAVIPLLVLGVAKLFVDVAVEVIGGGTLVLPVVGVTADSAQGLYLLGGLLLSVWLLDKATGAAEEIVRTHSTNRVESHVHALIMRKCSTLDAAFYESPKYLDLLERAVRGALMNSLSFMWGFYFLVQAAISLVATIAVLSTIHWAIPVAMVLSALPQLIATSWFARRGWALENSLSTHHRLLKYLTGLMSERQTANEVRLFGLSDYFIPRFRQVNEQRLRREQSFTRKSTLWRASLGLLSDAVVAGVWVFIVLRALARAISVGDVVLGTQAAWRGKEALQQTFSYGGQFFEQTLTLVNLFTFLDLDPTAVPGSLRRLTVKRRMPETIDRVEFRHVSFAYPSVQGNVLDDVSFVMERGQKVALVGQNGSGKTTIVKLLTRLYDPTVGQILINGEDIREFDLAELQRRFAVVFQDCVRYALTARENVGFGDVAHVSDLQRIRAAADAAAVDEDLAALPDGFETFLGGQFGIGRDLSGGQWQKVGLARGYMRKGSLFVIDEPTAHLDALAEFEVFRSFLELTGEQTSVMISHRFSNVRLADHIIVLDSGRVVQQGTHDELTAVSGLYARMFETQASGYR
ncbi:MAG: ABC transporter ATP-binding protein [Spirochaetaceae bacterium]|nr:ABC transporter ATP-binding protein [Spirochaetaceae bacterium]